MKFLILISIFLSLSHINRAECQAYASIRDELILYIDRLPMDTPRLVRSCFYSIPARYRQNCRDKSVALYTKSLYAAKRTCCTRWAEMDCMKKYLYNSIYCNINEQRTVARFFKTIQRISLANETGDCLNYPPVEMDSNPIFRHDGIQPRCSAKAYM